VNHIDILGMCRSLNTLEDFCDIGDFQYASKEVRKSDPLVNLDASELSQIKGMQGTFNRDVAFDMDDDIIIMPNFVTRKQNQLLVMPIHALIGICTATLNPYVPRKNTMHPFLNQCATIVEDSCVREECMINFVEICPIGKKVNG